MLAVTTPASETENHPIPTLPMFNENLPPTPHLGVSFSEVIHSLCSVYFSFNKSNFLNLPI